MLQELLIVFIYLVAWLVTRYFYRKHKAQLENDGTTHCLVEERRWFHYATFVLVLVALGATFIPYGKMLVVYVVSTIVAYAVWISFSESMIRAGARHDVYEN